MRAHSSETGIPVPNRHEFPTKSTIQRPGNEENEFLPDKGAALRVCSLTALVFAFSPDLLIPCGTRCRSDSLSPFLVNRPVTNMAAVPDRKIRTPPEGEILLD